MNDKDKAIVALARDNFPNFCVAAAHNYEPLWFHRKIAQALDRVEKGLCKRLIITVPPQHGKSLHSSILFPAYCLGKNPNRKVIASSYSGLIAQRFGREVRNLIAGDKMRAIFPELVLADDSQAKNKFDTSEGGYYIAQGREGSITSYGADIMILDDLYSNRLEAESSVIRESVWDLYTSVYKTRLHQNSALVMLMTRWHDDDLIGRTLRLEEGWELLEFPALAEFDEPKRKKGEPLWPAKFDRDYLLSIKAVSPDLFSCMYQCRPLDLENALFKREWFKYFDPDELPAGMNYYITVDPAISQKEEADDTSIIVTAVGFDRSIYVCEYTAAHLDPDQTINEILRLADKYKPIKIGIESVGYQASLQHFMKKEMLFRYKTEGAQPFSVEEIKTPTDRSKKDKIINSLLPFYKNGLIFHADGLDKLEDQLMRFPKGTKDDVLDSLAMAVPLWSQPISKIGKEIPYPTKARDFYRNEKDILRKMLMTPRS